MFRNGVFSISQSQVAIKTPEFVSLSFQSAGLGSRSAAFIIDQAIITAVQAIIIFLLILLETGQPAMLTNGSLLPLAIAIILIFLLNWAYFFLLEYFYQGRTIGKKIIGIRVIQENGHSITILSSFIRNLMRIIDSLPSGYLIGIVMIFFHSKHKRMGDLVAGTIVVHERKQKKQKQTLLETEIEQRGLSKEDIVLNNLATHSFGKKEWDLLKTYVLRFLHLPYVERVELTNRIAGLLFPKVGIELDNQSNHQLESTLLILYLIFRDEWEYEL